MANYGIFKQNLFADEHKLEPVEGAGFTSPVCAVTKHVESISTTRYYADADAEVLLCL